MSRPDLPDPVVYAAAVAAHRRSFWRTVNLLNTFLTRPGVTMEAAVLLEVRQIRDGLWEKLHRIARAQRGLRIARGRGCWVRVSYRDDEGEPVHVLEQQADADPSL